MGRCLDSGLPILTLGKQTTTAASRSVATATTPTANLLIYKSVAIRGSHGGIGANPGSPMSVACVGANNLCVVTVYRMVSSVGKDAKTAITTDPVRTTMPRPGPDQRSSAMRLHVLK